MGSYWLKPSGLLKTYSFLLLKIQLPYSNSCRQKQERHYTSENKIYQKCFFTSPKSEGENLWGGLTRLEALETLF